MPDRAQDRHRQSPRSQRFRPAQRRPGITRAVRSPRSPLLAVLAAALVVLAVLLTGAATQAQEPAEAEEPTGICDRSQIMRETLMAKFKAFHIRIDGEYISDCSQVTDDHLAHVWLYWLTIDGSDYTGLDLKAGDFDGMTNLRSLLLKNFDGVTALPSLSDQADFHSLDLRNNPKLATLPDLSPNTKLQSLELNGNNISALPDLSKNTKLEILRAADNNLSSLPDLSKNILLTELILSGNQLTSLQDLSKHTALTKLDLTGNRLTATPDLSKNILLTELNLSGNQLTAAPNLSTHTALIKLDLSGNPLTSLPSLSQSTALTHLNIAGTGLTTPPDLSANTKLQVLNVNDNQLTALPDLSANTELRWVWARRNQLTALPDLSQNTALTQVSVRGNQLTALPDLSANTELVNLWVYDNKLTALPDLSQNTKLRTLDAHNNRIYPLPTLSGISKLTLTPQAPLTFSVADAQANEGANAQLTITLSEAASSSLSFSVTVSYGSGDGAADASDLGTLPASATVASGSSTATLSIPIAADAAEEEDETFTVSVTTETPGWMPQGADPNAQRVPATATVTIKNVAEPEPQELTPQETIAPAQKSTATTETLKFKKTSVEAVEGENRQIRITRSGDTSSAVTLTLSYADGSATSPGDYNSDERSITIPSGKRYRDIRLRIVNDSVDEGDETFTMSLSTDAEGYTVGGSATVTIKDDDTAAVDLSKTAINVKETGKKAYQVSLATKPSADVTITATSGDPEKATLNKQATATLTFTPENWNKKRKITVRAKLVGDVTVSVTHAATSTDPKYNSIVIAPVSVTIEALDTPGPITNLQVSAVQDNSVTVTWDPPTNGEQLQRYSVKLEPQGEAKGKISAKFERPYHPKRRVVFTDLQPGVTYKVHVWVRNARSGPEGKSQPVASPAFSVPATEGTSPPSG